MLLMRILFQSYPPYASVCLSCRGGIVTRESKCMDSRKRFLRESMDSRKWILIVQPCRSLVRIIVYYIPEHDWLIIVLRMVKLVDNQSLHWLLIIID